MERFYFKTREEAVDFLEKHNVNHPIPKLENKLRMYPNEIKQYYIRVNEKNEVEYCNIIASSDGHTKAIEECYNRHND